ncbi:hypothetical protein HAX54_051834, partial [Datura stramonium]|nr:hypothetical protein [Datura stramonium]
SDEPGIPLLSPNLPAQGKISIGLGRGASTTTGPGEEIGVGKSLQQNQLNRQRSPALLLSSLAGGILSSMAKISYNKKRLTFQSDLSRFRNGKAWLLCSCLRFQEEFYHPWRRYRVQEKAYFSEDLSRFRNGKGRIEQQLLGRILSLVHQKPSSTKAARSEVVSPKRRKDGHERHREDLLTQGQDTTQTPDRTSKGKARFQSLLWKRAPTGSDTPISWMKANVFYWNRGMCRSIRL